MHHIVHLNMNSYDTDVNECVKRCENCALVNPITHPVQLKRRGMLTSPSVDLAIDFCGPLPSGHYLLVVVDYYSWFKEVTIKTKIISQDTIEHLTKLFALFGYPKTLTADEGRQFTSREFKSFCQENQIHLYTTPPYWPQANGLVERQNRPVLQILRISECNGGDLNLFAKVFVG
jgi:transposase InsO family protein